MTSQVIDRPPQRRVVERLARTARSMRGQMDGFLFRSQLGPTRDTEWRDFNPGRRI